MDKLIKQRSDSMDIRGLLDAETPVNEPLSGIYKRSFGYFTIKDRLPIILTRIVDTLSRDKEEIAQKYGSEAIEDVKQITGFLSKLKNELTTNKPLQPLNGSEKFDDVKKWNDVLEERTKIEGETPTWFNTIWLYCECYMYRRIAQEIALTKCMSSYDPFQKQKEDSFTNSMASVISLGKYTIGVVDKAKSLSSSEAKMEFMKLVQLNLWGNKCDLSLSAGADVSQSEDPVQMLDSLENDLLVNHTESVWNLLQENSSNPKSIVDIVLDNAGYELFTDLGLAAFLSARNFAKKIRFYVKRFPWYVSDVTEPDFHWVVDSLRNSNDESLKSLGEICHNHLSNKTWTIEVDSFWTNPYDFAQMKAKDPALYGKLGEAVLVIFKGDLNYRKLLGDINWEHSVDFLEALRGFRPTNLVSLRTLKCDIVAGVSPAKAAAAQKEDPDWMKTGRFGVIQATVETSSSGPEKQL